jgi:hypothetical protein
MRLSLKQIKRADWIELGSGVALKVAPLGQLHLDRAEARAGQAAREIVESAARLTDYGLEQVEAGILFDPEDLDVTAGSGLLLYAVELAMIGVKDWRGFDDEDGQPIDGRPIERRKLAILFHSIAPDGPESFAARFIKRACAIPLLERSEGNVLAAGLSGDGAPAASVQDASKSAPPARAADPSA